MDQAWRKAIQACSDFLEKGNQIDIVFAVLDDRILEAGVQTLDEIAPQYTADAPYAKAGKADWMAETVDSLQKAEVLKDQ